MEHVLEQKNSVAQLHGSLRIILLLSGILSSIVYIIANITCAIRYDGYNPSLQTVSELSAIDSPTRALWISFMIVYSILVIAFGSGILLIAKSDQRLRTAGILLIINTLIGFFWPPMHQREVLAAGGGTLTDTLHIVFALITVPVMILIIWYGSKAVGKSFHTYSIITLIVLIVAGAITAMDGPKISQDLPTPGIGIWERINIGVYMLWVIMLSMILVRRYINRQQL